MHTDTDIALIGAGPAGLEMAIALQRAGLAYTHLEASQIGATMAWWPPATRWFSSNDRISIAGVPLITPSQEKATREEYLAYLRAIVLQFNLPIRLYEPVTQIQSTPAGFLLASSHQGIQNTLHARRLILSTGGTAIARKLHLPGEELPNVTHYLQDPHAYFRQKLLIIGGRNAAVESALRCHRAGAAVTLSYRGATIDDKHIKYWLWPEFDGLVKSKQIQFLPQTQPLAFTPSHATLRHASGETFDLPMDFVLLHTGYLADMSLFQSAGVTLTPPQNAPIFNPETMETNIPHLYVCGTAIGGTQDRYRIFLENCHVHIPRIIAALQGRPTHLTPSTYAAPET